jgi:hypothetical protein
MLIITSLSVSPSTLPYEGIFYMLILYGGVGAFIVLIKVKWEGQMER